MTEIHIAGLEVQVGNHVRQRCGWCGSTLLDYDLTRIAMLLKPGDPIEPRPTMWPVGALVATDGAVSHTLEHTDGDQLPDRCCGSLDPEVTR